VFAAKLTTEWAAWVAILAAPLHRRLAWRLPAVVGILLASGRRTVANWWRAARVGDRFRSYYYFLDSLGRKAVELAAVLVGIVLGRIDPGGRLLFAIDDTPTKRYGPKVQGAGIHHNPTPGPAGSKFLYGHSWVVLSRIARHEHHGAISLPLLGHLHVRKKDVPTLPPSAGISFRTKVQMAAEQVDWLRSQLSGDGRTPWVAVDGGYAKREFLRPAQRAGFVVVARLRKDAALYDLATWRPAGGVVRVVIIKEDDGSWRASLCTDAEASVAAIVQATVDRWGIEQNLHDLKEVEGIEQVQLRRVWSNVGALNLNLWVHTLTEVWAWSRPASAVSDRSDRPWDDTDRRPSHADRRRAVQRAMWEEEFQRLRIPAPWTEKIHSLLAGMARLVA